MHPHNFITPGHITIWSFTGLIKAVSEVFQPEEEQLVAEVVSHLINNGRSDTWVNEENQSLNLF